MVSSMDHKKSLKTFYYLMVFLSAKLCTDCFMCKFIFINLSSYCSITNNARQFIKHKIYVSSRCEKNPIYITRSTTGRETEANRCKITPLRSSHRSQTQLRENPTILGYTASIGLTNLLKIHTSNFLGGKKEAREARNSRALTLSSFTYLAGDNVLIKSFIFVHRKTTTVQNKSCNSELAFWSMHCLFLSADYKFIK